MSWNILFIYFQTRTSIIAKLYHWNNNQVDLASRSTLYIIKITRFLHLWTIERHYVTSIIINYIVEMKTGIDSVISRTLWKWKQGTKTFYLITTYWLNKRNPISCLFLQKSLSCFRRIIRKFIFSNIISQKNKTKRVLATFLSVVVPIYFGIQYLRNHIKYLNTQHITDNLLSA